MSTARLRPRGRQCEGGYSHDHRAGKPKRDPLVVPRRSVGVPRHAGIL